MKFVLTFLCSLLLFCEFVKAAELAFTQDIRPILSDKCYNCHGADKKVRKAKLRLDDRVAVLEAGVLSDGEMLKRLTSDDPEERMPPVKSNRVLHDEDRAKRVQWLKASAKWPEDDRHWAFVTPKRPELPKVKNSQWVRNDIDYSLHRSDATFDLGGCSCVG